MGRQLRFWVKHSNFDGIDPIINLITSPITDAINNPITDTINNTIIDTITDPIIIIIVILMTQYMGRMKNLL